MTVTATVEVPRFNFERRVGCQWAVGKLVTASLTPALVVRVVRVAVDHTEAAVVSMISLDSAVAGVRYECRTYTRTRALT